MIILDRLPYSADPTMLGVMGEMIRVRSHQIIVQVSLSLLTTTDWDPRTPRFPAILDTGNNHNFAIRRSHLIRWTGMQLDAFRSIGTIREKQQRVPLYAAALWLHPNIRQELRLSDHTPHLLQVKRGIAVFPDETGPRLPVLGMRALTLNKLHLVVDGERRLVNLRTPDWRTQLLRWLS